MPIVPFVPANRVERQEGDHLLQTAWSFWYDQKQVRSKVLIKPSDYKGSIIKLGTFDSVEGFWKVFCYMKRPSILEINVKPERQEGEHLLVVLV
jgi:hypothetical protein